VLDTLPPVSVEAFAGVSNLAVSADIPPEARVLDLGCGAGLDSLILARRVGATGRVVGIDFSGAMLLRARKAAAACGAVNVTFYQGDAERLPLDEASVDVALVNGIFNLNPGRAEIFRELAPGRATGRTHLRCRASPARSGNETRPLHQSRMVCLSGRGQGRRDLPE
jgi:SAM-dependent methyltransferase